VGVCGDVEFGEEPVDALFDFVADGSDAVHAEPGGVLQDPFLVPFAGEDGQASPQPMVTTTSAARTTSSVQGLGYSVEMSMPRSFIAAIAAG